MPPSMFPCAVEARKPSLYVSLRGGGTQTQIDLFRRAAQRARQPWKEEDEALHELSKRVAALKKKRIRDEE